MSKPRGDGKNGGNTGSREGEPDSAPGDDQNRVLTTGETLEAAARANDEAARAGEEDASGGSGGELTPVPGIEPSIDRSTDRSTDPAEDRLLEGDSVDGEVEEAARTAEALIAPPSPWKRRLMRVGFLLLLTFILLSVPVPEPRFVASPGSPFRWNMDDELARLEAVFSEQRRAGCESFDGAALLAEVEESVRALRAICPAIVGTRMAPPSPDAAAEPPPASHIAEADACIEAAPALIRESASRFYEASARFAACPANARALGETYSALRGAVKDASWVASQNRAPLSHALLYRALYGSRLAFEEVLLQMRPEDMPVFIDGQREDRTTPSAVMHDVTVHSGDLLVSRGGAPTSAMIARGSDHPGNFSHVAVVYLEGEAGSESRRVETLEAHIERGVVVEDFERYEEAEKLRVMLLRVRNRAAPSDPLQESLVAARNRFSSTHVAYDFENLPHDHEEMYCSEVASSVYEELVELWMYPTTVSSEGAARWLSHFGVRNFESFGPSDLEYDPAVVVIAEWRDPETLLADHLDAAILDAFLEQADQGATLPAPIHRLAFARLVKAVSLVQVWLGREGTIPEGMSASTALRVESLRAWHAAALDRLRDGVETFRELEGYTPAFTSLAELARDAVERTAP